jgi:hypothetical protein
MLFATKSFGSIIWERTIPLFFYPRTAILSADNSSTNFRQNCIFVVGFLLASIALSL